jgi:SnoaL-like domain
MATPAPASNSFTALLTTFAEAVQANHGQRLATLFTQNGVYEDGFFGAHTGRAAIAAMLQRFHDTGSGYFWEFVDPVSNGAIGYARFRFSYTSRLPESMGRAVLFEGISCFRFRAELISHYSEAFDRGVALAQLAFPAERIKAHLGEGRGVAKPAARGPATLGPVFAGLRRDLVISTSRRFWRIEAHRRSGS